ncbi:sensor histidine kinase [Jiangella mangrovi]|uniref:histidine kinase n=1 Tax=Jiangella mangrovi TaxID=1524084 RepID=A0A7W9GRW3_9ACTN|nr:GAF domain-containing protein [Jiangella mangrovi]MBB5788912.1 signal transduction histidine kinase [Jiangella mangrovi]
MDAPLPRIPAAGRWRRALVAAGVAAALIVAAAGATVWWNVRDLTAELAQRDADTVAALAGTLALLPADERAGALPAEPGGRSGVWLVAADGTVTPPALAGDGGDARWQRWTGLVARDARLTARFDSRDPGGTPWSFVAARLPDGTVVLLGRPDAPGPGAVAVMLAAVAGGAALLAVIAWALFRWGVRRPMDDLLAATEDLRWRGRIRDETRPRVDRVARRDDHAGRLARSLAGVEQDVGRRFLQLSTLLETIRAVGASLDGDEVLDRVLGQLQRLFGVERCAVVTLDERAGAVLVRASRGLSDAFVADLRADVAEPGSPSLRALRSGEPVQVSDTAADLSFAAVRDGSPRFDHRSVLAIPLATSMAPPSVLLLYRSEAYRYSHSELELATSFARFASIAIENAALYTRIDARLQEQSRRLEAIIESLDDGLVLAGPDGRVAYHNAAAAALLGSPGQGMTGDDVGSLLRRLGADPAVAPGGEPGEVLPASREVTTKADGVQRDLRLRTFTVADERGAPIGHGHLWQDITHDRLVARLKASLLATASHELRTPLASIKGYASTLLAEDIEWSVEEQRQFLTTISAETDRLTALVRDLLDMSRIEAGALTIRREPVGVAELVRRAVAGRSTADRERLDLRLPRGRATVDVDRSRIETAISNLVGNALKFSPEGQPVTVTAQLTGGELRVTVRDRGTGVPPDLGERIFESFVRGDDGLARQAGGLGLGLAICRGFVEAHGGRVRCRPERPGTSFVLTIPAGEADA